MAPASIALNPDTLGMLQQTKTTVDDVNIPDLQHSVNVAYCVANSNPKTLVSMKTEYKKCNELTTAQNSPPIEPFIPPTLGKSMKGWVEANNAIIHDFGNSGPLQQKVSFGWVENMWANGSSTWLHDHSNQALQGYVHPMVDLLTKYGVYNGRYQPDFIAFDKYEMDAIPGANWPRICFQSIGLELVFKRCKRS